MAQPPDDEVQAHERPRRWFAWVWAVPIAAAVIVLWLAWRSLATRGPEITISFKTAQGVQAGQTKIEHRNVNVGTVTGLQLSSDMSRVIVHARMRRSVEPYLNANTLFYVVGPRVSAAGISGLSTIVSGTYIEMVPGKGGASVRHFTGLDQPPVLRPDASGTSYLLQAKQLGALERGSPVSFRGVAVGQVEGFRLDPKSRTVRITAFVRSPYDQLVHPQTHFWNSGGIDLSFGAQGLHVRATSWQEVISGGIEFETPRAALSGKPSPGGSVFRLYDNERRARRAPAGHPLRYVASFSGSLHGLAKGSLVRLQGVNVGEVEDTHLQFDRKRHTLRTRVRFLVYPTQVQIAGMPHTGADHRADVTAWLEELVSRGLRAQVGSANLITGQKVLALSMVSGAPAAHIRRAGKYQSIPSAPGVDLPDILRNLRGVLANLNKATSGPDLAHALKELDGTLTHLNQLTQQSGPDLQALIKSLRGTSDAAQRTLQSLQGMVGKRAYSNVDLQRMMSELTQAARSVRELADYLDQHPEALLRGRSGGEQ